VIFLDKKRVIQRVFQKHVWGKTPFIQVTDDEKTLHKLWRIDEPALLEMIENSMNEENMFIADGHHRYEVSCAWRDLMRENLGSRFNGDEDFNYCLSYFTNTDPRGLSISPIHRLFTLGKELNLQDFILKAKEYFDVDHVKDKIRFFFLCKRLAVPSTCWGCIRRANIFFCA
jgi:uncharacterized protein (DUF1015 family)